MLRKIAERLARGWKIKRKLPKRFGGGAIYVSPDAQLKYLKLGENAFDKNLIKIVDKHIGQSSVVWDIGANVGVFAFSCAGKCVKGSVLAVEADIWLASLLSASKKFEENKTFAISILPCAISDCNGIAKFSIAKRGRASNHLESVEGRGTAGGSREVVCVPTLTLSKLLDFFDPPTFLKIDVEGAEKMVLAGGEKVFSDARPVTFIEVGTENNAFVTSFFKNMDYLLFDGNTDLEFQKPSSECFGDTLAFPKEQYDLVLAKKGK